MASALDKAMAKASVESPLTTLVRRASSRRMKPPRSLDRTPNQHQPDQQAPAITVQYDDTPQPASEDNYYQYHAYGGDESFQPPHSPLLHGHFARDSVATASSYDNSYQDASSSANSSRVQSFSSNAYPDSELDYRFGYDNPYEESVYSQPDNMLNYDRNSSAGAALRDSWASTTSASTVRGQGTRLSEGRVMGSERLASGEGSRGMQGGTSSDSVYYNSPQWADIQEQYFADEGAGSHAPASPIPVQHTVTAGRTPIVKPVSANFSRPARPALLVDQGSEERKRQVLARNATNRQKSPSRGQGSSLRNEVGGGGQGQHSAEEQGTSGAPTAASPSSGVYTNTSAASSKQHLSPQQAQQSTMSRQPSNLSQNSQGSSQQYLSPQHTPAPAMSRQTSNSSQSSTGSNQYLSPQQAQPPALSGQSSNLSQTSQRSPSPAYDASNLRQQQIPSGAQPPRVQSSMSLYSNYSYYQYDSAVPSPTGSTFSNSGDPFSVKKPNAARSSNLNPSSSRSPSPLPPQQDEQAQSSIKNPKTAHDFLLLGIEHHEADRLKESARCFERSTVEGGGCGVGMLMWGLTLRHGWGCPKNEKAAFKWLQKAAESAVEDLEATRSKGIKDNSVVKSELILAIYEVGQCFFQGWGVPKDQKMAFSYYTIAAELGDPDAQMDLAFCLTNGKGCKKDKVAAAKWYREAIKQGQSDVGLAWIYKDKYQ